MQAPITMTPTRHGEPDLELASSTGSSHFVISNAPSPQQRQTSPRRLGDYVIRRPGSSSSSSSSSSMSSPTSVVHVGEDDDSNDNCDNDDYERLLAPASSASLVDSSKNRLSLRLNCSDGPREETPSEDDTKDDNNNKSGDTTFKTMLLGMLVVQASAAILTGRYTRSSVPPEDLYEINHLVLVIECTKLIMSVLMEYVTTQGELWDSLLRHVFKKPLDSIKVLVPAVMYVIQNSLIYIALSNLSAPLFLALQQGKLITTAIVSVLMLQRSYSIKQWTCLFILAAGVAIVVLDEKKAKNPETTTTNDNETTANSETSESEQFFVIGLLAVTGACFSSAFAGVYFEKVLAPEKAAPKPSGPPSPRTVKAKRSLERMPVRATDKSGTPSLWMRNMQLAFFSIVCASFQGNYQVHWDSSGDENEVVPKTYLHGFTCWVWLLVALQAFGGLLVAAVMKYADNVLKGVAMGISVVVASMVSTLLFDVHLSSQFALGATVIFGSVYCFSNDLPTWSVLMQSLNTLT